MNTAGIGQYYNMEAGDAANLSSLKRVSECDPQYKRTILIRTSPPADPPLPRPPPPDVTEPVARLCQLQSVSCVRLSHR